MSSYRVFGGVNGNYGTGIQGMVTASDRWTSSSEIAQVYMNNMGAYYGSEEGWEIPGAPSASTTCTSSWAGSIFL